MVDALTRNLDRREFLQREVSILNQIQETFPTAMKSKATKVKFAEQITAIAEQMQKRYAYHLGIKSKLLPN